MVSSEKDDPRDDACIQVLTPVFNDWKALALMLPKLDEHLAHAGVRAELLVVDDGSTEGGADSLEPLPALSAIRSVRVLTLRRNMGHQRAIGIGLSYIEAYHSPEIVVVMDSDGEDAPADVPRMLERVREERGQRAVFARRKRRSEGLTFRVFYQLYRLTYRMLVGHNIQFGNFSAIPGRQLTRLVAQHELWNHYAAAFRKSRIPYVLLDTRRAKRLDGKSSMNLVSLVTHGLSAMSVFGEVVGTRMLAATGGLSLLAVLGITSVVAIRLSTDWAVPGWATTAVGMLGLVLLQAVTVGFLLTFVTLANRSQMAPAPCQTFRDYILELHLLRDGTHSYDESYTRKRSDHARPYGIDGLAEPEPKQRIHHA